MLSYEIELDDLDHIIVSIITRNSGTTAYQIHYTIEKELNECIDPAIILNRIERLLSFNILRIWIYLCFTCFLIPSD